MQIVKILHFFIAVLLLTAILCPTSILVHVINENKQTSTTFINNNHHQEQYIDNTTITSSTKTTTLFILEEHSTSHHRVRRNIHDPLSNPWLHSKQELLELLWKRGNELHKDENDNENIEQDDDHQTSLSTLNEQHHQPSSQHHYNKHLTMVGASLSHNKKQNNKRMNNNKSDQLLTGKSIDCCPSVLEMVEPHGGTNINGTYVELYQDGSVKQRFYELSCDRYVEGKPCLFMDRKLYNISKCVQKYSYSYALVRENVKTTPSSTVSSTTSRQHHHNHRHNNNFNSGSGSGWMLDYIRVRSGCSCEVTPVIYKKKRTNNKHKKNKIKKHG